MACQQAKYKNGMPMGKPIHHWVNGLHDWHASMSIGSLDSLDMSQWAKVVKTSASWSIGMSAN
jgi:hypothetical protein